MANKFIETIKKIMLVCAGFHMILLTIYSIITKDMWHLNLLNILDLEKFFTFIKPNFWIDFIALELFILLFVVIYFFFTKK